jgi:hypothetical protein
MKTCDDGPCSRERVSRHLASDGHSATRSWPCGHAVDPSTARPETIGGRTARKPGDRGGSRSGSWLRRDDPSGCPSWRRPSAARLRARLDTREFELGNLQLLVPPARPSVNYFFLSESTFHQRQRDATSSGNRQIQLLRPASAVAPPTKAPSSRAAASGRRAWAGLGGRSGSSTGGRDCVRRHRGGNRCQVGDHD